MARIVLAQGTSHSPQLSIDPARWGELAARDETHNLLKDRAGRVRDFADLAAERGDALAAQLTPEVWQQRKQRCDEAIDRLRQDMAAAGPDVVIVIGDDQNELLHDDNLPAVLVYRGATIRSTGRTAEDTLARHVGNPVRELAEWAYSPAEDTEYPVAQDLADHLLRSLCDAGFDVAQSSRTPEGRGVGHAFGFPYERLFDRPRPSVPLMINTYYPPNQPTPTRCVALGHALRQAVEAFGDGGTTVAVLASGGLSHHLIDEELDRIVLDALEKQDLEPLAGLPVAALDGGTSEIRNWVTMAACLPGLEHRWTVYEPCYRTRAGTGCAMAFATWSAA